MSTPTMMLLVTERSLPRTGEVMTVALEMDSTGLLLLACGTWETAFLRSVTMVSTILLVSSSSSPE